MSIDRVVQESRHGALAVGLLAAMVAPGSRDARMTGTITGMVSTGSVPTKMLPVTIDPTVCGQELPDEAVVTDRRGGLANAIVRVAGVKANTTAPTHGSLNEKCRFVPRVQIVRPKTTITTSSGDPILHTTNAQTDNGRTIFNVALPIPGVKITKPVNSPGLLRLSCNTHPWMRGWILVTDDVAVVTGADGRFTLSDMPAGTYELSIWHGSLRGASQKITVTTGQTATANFTLK